MCLYIVLSMVLKHIRETWNELVLLAHVTWGCWGTWAWTHNAFGVHDLGLVISPLVPQSPHHGSGAQPPPRQGCCEDLIRNLHSCLQLGPHLDSTYAAHALGGTFGPTAAASWFVEVRCSVPCPRPTGRACAGQPFFTIIPVVSKFPIKIIPVNIVHPKYQIWLGAD